MCAVHGRPTPHRSLQATLAFKLGGDPPHMSFSAYTPATQRGPSVFTTGAHPRRRTTQPGHGQPPPTYAPPKAPAAPPTHMAGPTHARAPPLAPLPASAVPSEAPQQGVWYNGNPFGARATLDGHSPADRSTAETIPEAPADPQLPHLEDSDSDEAMAGPGSAAQRPAGAVGEGTEGHSGASHSEPWLTREQPSAEGLQYSETSSEGQPSTWPSK